LVFSADVTFRPVARLKPKDTVAVIAPAGPFDRPGFDAGRAKLEPRYTLSFDEGLYSAHRYLAGDDARRLAELRKAFGARGIFCARGGYGAMRLLPALEPREVPAIPLVGFSDITALHALWLRAGYRCVHGPVLTQLGRAPANVVDRLTALLESDALPAPLSGQTTVVPGVAQGPLIGGNLSVLTRLIGTPWMPPLDGAVLLLEDVTERPYRLDRMWMHLKLAGLLDRVAGVALGDFTGCEEKGADYGPFDVLDELARALGKPCLRGLPIGHEDLNLPVVLGAQVRLDATQRRLEFLEPLVSA
jgi:muramoyltetrapeptide carboxypeptidase